MAEPIGAVEAVKAVMEKTGYTCASLGKSIGVKNTAIWDRLNNSRKKTDNMKIDTMVQMLRSMQYKVVIVPADKRVQEGEFELK